VAVSVVDRRERRSKNEASAAVLVRVVGRVDGQLFAVQPELTVQVVPTVRALVYRH